MKDFTIGVFKTDIHQECSIHSFDGVYPVKDQETGKHLRLVRKSLSSDQWESMALMINGIGNLDGRLFRFKVSDGFAVDLIGMYYSEKGAVVELPLIL